jgi:hypothetical protein
MIQRRCYTELKMQFAATVVFVCSFGLLAPMLAAQEPVLQAENGDLARAQKEIEKLRDLVKAGAVAPARLQDAEQALSDAQDQAILNRTLYGKVTAQDLTDDQAREMIAAAGRRLDRGKERLARQQKLVDAGVIARGELEPLQQDIDSRQLTVDLAQSRARLLNEIADMANREQAAVMAASLQTPVDHRIMDHFEGDGVFTAQELKNVETAYQKEFKSPLPISANGETEVHRLLGFDHRGRVDVAITPDQREGVWLRAYLEKNDIPYYAFRAAVAGKATGAHIHIGPGSTRLRAAD